MTAFALKPHPGQGQLRGIKVSRKGLARIQAEVNGQATTLPADFRIGGQGRT